MFKIYDGRESFYQWDVNQKLIVESTDINEVHFCNRTDECALVCKVYDLGGKRVVDVPNVLFQTDWNIKVFGYNTDHTEFAQTFKVNSRSKPEDYVYTEEELRTWEELEQRIDQIEEQGVSDERIGEAVADYLVKNPVEVDLTGYATEKYVDDAISAIELTPGPAGKDGQDGAPGKDGQDGKDYVLTDADKAEIAGMVKVPETDLTNYATKDYVAQEIAEAQLGGGGGEVNLDNYYTKSEVDSAIQAIELTPGPVGPKGEDGYTPVKGVDYFDGKDGADSTVPGPTGPKGEDGYTPVKGVDYFDGAPGEPGKDGYTPVKGTDYWTAADQAQMLADVIAALPVYGGEIV